MAIQHQLELTFPAKKVTEPILCRMGRTFPIVYSIDRANVSHHQGHFHLTLLGDEAQVKAAEAFLREQGVQVNVLGSGPFTGELPPTPKQEKGRPGEPVVARKLWLTFVGRTLNRPMIWEMASRYDVTFDVRQSSTGEVVEIMALLLEGPESQVNAAMRFLESKGVEVEPIEKSVIEG